MSKLTGTIGGVMSPPARGALRRGKRDWPPEAAVQNRMARRAAMAGVKK